MKIDFHPPHLILVHFPAALFPMEFVCAALGFYLKDATFNYAAFYAFMVVTESWAILMVNGSAT